MKKLILIGIVLASAFAVYSQDAAVTVANTVLRQIPAYNGRVIRKLKFHAIVHVVRHKGSWAYIKADESVGWVPANSISPVKAMRLDSATYTEIIPPGVTAGDTSGDTDSRIYPDLPPAPNPTRPMPNTVSAGVLNGKATSLPKPAYPAAARAVHASGTVTVQVLIDETVRSQARAL